MRLFIVLDFWASYSRRFCSFFSCFGANDPVDKYLSAMDRVLESNWWKIRVLPLCLAREFSFRDSCTEAHLPALLSPAVRKSRRVRFPDLASRNVSNFGREPNSARMSTHKMNESSVKSLKSPRHLFFSPRRWRKVKLVFLPFLLAISWWAAKTPIFFDTSFPTIRVPWVLFSHPPYFCCTTRKTLHIKCGGANFLAEIVLIPKLENQIEKGNACAKLDNFTLSTPTLVLCKKRLPNTIIMCKVLRRECSFICYSCKFLPPSDPRIRIFVGLLLCPERSPNHSQQVSSRFY